MSEQIPRLVFSRNWEDPADFSTVQHSEIQNRKDIQYLFTEIQNYLNHVMIPVLELGNWAGSGGGGSGGGGGGGGDLSAYLPLSGGTMRGVLRLFRNPRLSDEAVPKQYVDTLTDRVKTDLEGQISVIDQRADGIELLVQNNQGEIASLTIRVNGIESRVVDNEHNISAISQRADSIELRVQNNENGIAALTIRADAIQARVENNEAGIAQLIIRAEGIEARVEDNESNISEILQRADSIELRVRNNEDGIAALTIRADGIETRVENNEGGISEIRQTADEISTRVTDLNTSLTSRIDQRAASIEMMVEDLDEDVNSRIRQLADSISLEVSAPFAEGERTYSRITLKIGPNNIYGDILMDGNVDISGQLSAEALYAAYGEVADLEVDRLSTSRRIVKYLAGDSGDDNYIRIREQVMEFVAGHCLGGTAQARTPGGDPLYWPEDISGLPRGTDGYPRMRTGERVYTTTHQTEFPVMVYTYSEEVKRSIRFVPGQSGAYEPVDVFGAGNAAGYNQGFLQKSTEGMEMRYVTPVGKQIGLRMGADGYTELTGLRKTVSLDFSNWDSGNFYEQVEGTGTTLGYSVSFDAQSRPTSITDGSGHRLSITW